MEKYGVTTSQFRLQILVTDASSIISKTSQYEKKEIGFECS